MLLFKISGPALPKALVGHSSLSQGNNLLIIGGQFYSNEGQYYDSISKLSCNNGQFTWEEMNVKLKTARNWFVADFIPN